MIALLLLASSLYEQAVTRVLAERYPATEYLLIEARSGRVVASNWAGLNEPIPVGSLTKPFLAAGGRDAEFVCRPGQCWLPQGHGVMRRKAAIANSCNAWFLRYAVEVRHVSGLPRPPSYDPATLIGLRPEWRIAPVTLARGYPSVIGDAVVKQGMHEAVEHGTAQRLRVDALAKTGTAACSHEKRGPGDGLVVTLWPADEPRYVLMVRVHGTTGANAAVTAGALLRVVRDGH